MAALSDLKDFGLFCIAYVPDGDQRDVVDFFGVLIRGQDDFFDIMGVCCPVPDGRKHALAEEPGRIQIKDGVL